MAFNLFKKLKDGLERTRKQFTEGVRQVLANFRPIDESLFEDLEEVLIRVEVAAQPELEPVAPPVRGGQIAAQVGCIEIA